MAKILSTGSMDKNTNPESYKATKSNVKREHKENKPGLISGTAKDGPGDSNRIPDTSTTLSNKDSGGKENWELEGGDTPSASAIKLNHYLSSLHEFTQ